MTQPAPINAFRILLVDDEDEVLNVVRRSLSEFGEDVVIDYAQDAAAADQLLSDRFYDLALLDVYGKKDVLVGNQVYRRIDAADLSTRVMMMTRWQLKQEALRLLALTGSNSAWRLSGFLDKTRNFGPTITKRVGELIRRFTASRADVSGLDQLATDILRQRYRYRDADKNINLRKPKVEIATEVDRLMRKLYVDLPAASKRVSRVQVEISPMGRRGLSAAVVVNAHVRVTFETIATTASGHRTVLKVGPKRDIFDEAARFHEYVRYGIELSHRVELLGVTGADALGGLIYSFAGGSYNLDLLALDEVFVDELTSGDLEVSSEALRSLFASRDWYGTPCGYVDVGEYFETNFRTDLPRSCDEGERQLAELSETWTQWPRIVRADGSKGVAALLEGPDGTKLAVPDQSVLGWGWLADQVPGCLVHGDMHGGNVMLECSRESSGTREGKWHYHRSCLIDFRNAGPGPRCIDAVCLESSIRLAEAEVMSKTVLRAGSPPSADEQRELAQRMTEHFEEELALYRAVFLGEGDVPGSAWAGQCALVLRSMRDCFDDVALREYLTTSVRYTLRSLGFRLPDVARLRLLAWLAGQYQLAIDLSKLKS
ncbi:response regulator [Actinoplanes sp. NPDC051633]|uniref:response regulator n=1 Tax=Actinoplanes sp. NPDC051633 TaxID=3155670 RepID=UPI00343B0E1D